MALLPVTLEEPSRRFVTDEPFGVYGTIPMNGKNGLCHFALWPVRAG
jgi:hypothetical protein